MSERRDADTISVKEASRILGMSQYTLYYWAQARKIPHYRIGRRVLFSRSDLAEWLNKHRVEEVE